MKRFLREPIVHFVLIGCVIFAVSALIGRSDRAASRRIVVTSDEKAI